MRISTATDLDGLGFDQSSGLLPVVAQHARTGEVLMLAFANREALERTLRDREMWYFSRSRSRLWRKGESSGNTLRLQSLHADCDRDSILALVEPSGPSCHTGEWTCFGAAPVLPALAAVIAQRTGSSEGSYTARLLADRNLRLKKIGEEAVELVLACAAGDSTGVAEEAADLLYHSLVASSAEGTTLDDVLRVLGSRAKAGS